MSTRSYKKGKQDAERRRRYRGHFAQDPEEYKAGYVGAVLKAGGPFCAECGAPMVLRQTGRFRYRNGSVRRFWGCSRYPMCRGIHGAHPNGEPMGIPAGIATKQKRIEAHAAMRAYQTAHGLSTNELYILLQSAFGMSAEECHVGRFDGALCDRVVMLCETGGLGYEQKVTNA